MFANTENVATTGLISSLTYLLQTNHQGQIGTSKTKSTGSPVLP